MRFSVRCASEKYVYFPLRSVSYDFRPVDDAEAGFHARAARERDYEYRPPVTAEDGWQTGTLAEVGLDPAPIREFVTLASADPRSVEDLDLHGLLIARHGKLVLEEYFHGYHRLKPHETRSAGKTLATMLVGAQMQKGAKLSPATQLDALNWADAKTHAKQAAAEKRAEARAKGYEGEACGECGNFTLVRNGTCLKCDTCGSTTGCS